MHLVEDENGNVQSVVDMTQDGTANVEANTEGKFRKAEFEDGELFCIYDYVEEQFQYIENSTDQYGRSFTRK